MGRGIVGSRLDDAPVEVQRLGVPLLAELRQRHVLQGACVVGRDLQSAAQMGLGVREPLGTHQHGAEVDVRRQIRRVEVQGAQVVAFRLVRPPQPGERATGDEVGVAVVRVEIQGAAQIRLGLGQASQMREYQPDAVLRLVGVRALGHGDVVGGERFFRTAGLEQRLAEIQMRVPRRRIVADDVAEEGRFVPVDARLPPRQRSQQHQHAGGDAHGAPPARPERPNHCRPCAPRGGEAEGGRRSAERGRATDEDGQRPDVGQILITVRDERELHVAVFHQPEHRRQRDREEQGAGERPATGPPAQHPERRGRGDGCDDVPPRERVRGVHLPVRVDDDESRRPEQLADIDPQRVRRDEHALDEGVIDVDDFLVIGHVRGGDAQPHREEWDRAEQVGSGHAPLLPPAVDQQGRGQGDADGFAEQPRGEQHERQDIAPRPVLRVRPFDEAEPRQRCAHVEQDGEQVLAPDHPGDGFDVDRMHGEYRRGDPRPGYRQPRQQPPHQHRIGPVQQQVDGVKAQRGEAPQPMFQPEGRISERPVVALALNLARREPDAPQAGRFPHGRGLGERPVVPDEAAQ